jgi:hypothetical protein
MHDSSFRGSFAALLCVSATTLGFFAACDDSSDDADNGSAGTSARAGSSSGGSNANGGMANAGESASGGKQTSNGGSYGVAGTSTNDGGATDAGGASAGSGGETVDENAGAGAGGEPACVPEAPALPTEVAAKIAAPEGTTLLRHFHAVGTQNYKCVLVPGQQGADPTFSWVFVGPVANMFNSCGTKVGHHFAVPASDPPAPEWQYDVDGSSVIGAKVDSSAVDGAIPELLLKEAGHAGVGVFANVTFVQRLKTVGGAAPAANTCTLAVIEEEQDVGYTAEYYFYSGGT